MPIDDRALMPSTTCLTQYVIYDRPLDQPDYIVVRPWDIRPDGPAPRSVAGLFKDLEKARAWCQQLGLVCMARSESDDPLIVEVWL